MRRLIARARQTASIWRRTGRHRLLLASSAGRALMLQHAETMLPRKLARSGAPAQTASAALVGRIAAAFVAAGGAEDNAGRSMWSEFARRNRRLIAALGEGRIDEAAAILANPVAHEQLYGFDALTASISTGAERVDPKWLALGAADALLRLAEATGAVRCFNQETVLYRRPRQYDVEATLAALDRRFGFRVDFPNPYAGEVGIATARGIASYRALPALYQSFAATRLLRPGARVLEIGAGLGRGAYYARAMGVGQYVLVDLPLTAACQAHFLGSVLGEDALSLHNETPRAIHIATPADFLEGRLGDFDLVVNVDSMTEMDPHHARAYWQAIKRHAGLLLSINHEANPFSVRELIEADPDVAEASRTPAWMRRGYVEEVVRFQKPHG